MKKTDAEILIDYRKKERLKQDEFADKVGISRELLSKMENEKAPITEKTKRLIEKEFGREFYTSTVNEDDVEYFTKGNKPSVNSLEYLTHSSIEIKAMLRMVLRTNGEILAASRGESVSKTISEISKGVEDEISAAFSELKRKF